MAQPEGAFINTKGGIGKNKEADLVQEHAITNQKDFIRGLGANKTENGSRRASSSADIIHLIGDNVDHLLSIPKFTSSHAKKTSSKDLEIAINILMFKMARENAPKMLQHYKDQKHIEILQKKKDEAISKQQRKNDEIIKIKGDIDTYGGQWVLEKDMERALENLSMTQKVDAVKGQIKYQKVVLKKNPEDKNFLKFSVEGNKFTLNQLLLNWRKLANLTISCVTFSEHTASVADSACRTNEVNRNLRNDGYTNDAMVSGRYTDRNQLRRKCFDSAPFPLNSFEEAIAHFKSPPVVAISSITNLPDHQRISIRGEIARSWNLQRVQKTPTGVAADQYNYEASLHQSKVVEGEGLHDQWFLCWGQDFGQEFEGHGV
ncbi:unnamed protein product [Mytilus edulis]|uniref:Uncharacterized protein n=1 Tax=Mytilus edulis TaxID=6550 RepID=A0A8S3VFC5_MYTED|nr:unnamed protein product [Mytilus edulis]